LFNFAQNSDFQGFLPQNLSPIKKLFTTKKVQSGLKNLFLEIEVGKTTS
jgi:hypothetical protein